MIKVASVSNNIIPEINLWSEEAGSSRQTDRRKEFIQYGIKKVEKGLKCLLYDDRNPHPSASTTPINRSKKNDKGRRPVTTTMMSSGANMAAHTRGWLVSVQQRPSLRLPESRPRWPMGRGCICSAAAESFSPDAAQDWIHTGKMMAGAMASLRANNLEQRLRVGMFCVCVCHFL